MEKEVGIVCQDRWNSSAVIRVIHKSSAYSVEQMLSTTSTNKVKVGRASL